MGQRWQSGDMYCYLCMLVFVNILLMILFFTTGNYDTYNNSQGNMYNCTVNAIDPFENRVLFEYNGCHASGFLPTVDNLVINGTLACYSVDEPNSTNCNYLQLRNDIKLIELPVIIIIIIFNACIVGIPILILLIVTVISISDEYTYIIRKRAQQLTYMKMNDRVV